MTADNWLEVGTFWCHDRNAEKQRGASVLEVERQATVWFIAWVISKSADWMNNVLPYILEEGFLRELSKAVGRLA